MAGTSLLVLIDDISLLLDDVATMTKIAAKNSGSVVEDVTQLAGTAIKKTSGVLGDDLALNAQQITEEEKNEKGNLIKIQAARELPVVYAVFKGSMKNKLILVPSALTLTALVPWSVTPLLMLGGAFLCFEGAEKILEKIFHKEEVIKEEKKFVEDTRLLTSEEIKEYEKEKIKGAIKTDFILSAEIVVISLGTMLSESLMSQAVTLSIVAVAMTIGVYGLVAGIVKADDFGLKLMESKNSLIKNLGLKIVNVMPFFMKSLSVLGTVAMFAVGGGIIEHGLPFMHNFTELFSKIPGGSFISSCFVGVVVGTAIASIYTFVKKLFNNRK
jgi:predicted DNA repair protein MutK